MTWGEFPLVPEKRKAILVLNNTDIEMCQYKPNDGDFLIDEEAYVLNFPNNFAGEMPVALRNIIDSRLVNPGVMLIQNPYDPNLYEEASVASENFALSKYMYFSTFCMYLGAKEVRIEQGEVETKSGKTSMVAKCNSRKTNLNGEIDKEKFSELSKKIGLIDEFNGGSPDIVSAENFIRAKGLLNDSNIRSLLDMRRGSNQLKARTLTLDLSREAKSNLNVAARLKVPAFVNLSANYSSILSEQYSFSLKINVKF